ncbi:hypothetical protein [Synechococcus sp. BO 8801]|uniref:hypothetical protein n=1 Tax=Synechococcus sp. BO 8801 TaxID=169670 RepID=UPI000B994DC6|nr:hypothetical protein [Synechococcus sp. BO 8801]
MQRRLLTIAWSSSQASGTLAIGATAWLLSGLTPSPLVNGVLPALATLPLLLPLPQRIRLGSLLQVLSLLLLLAVAAGLLGRSVLAPLLGIALLAVGLRLAQDPLQRQLHGRWGVPIGELRAGAEAGRLAGNLLTALLFPVGKALLQFGSALVLLLPLAPLVGALRAGGHHPVEHREGDAAAALTAAAATTAATTTAAAEPAPWRLEPGGVLQGLLLGGLFALLPLWVREQAAGSCFDFGLLLTAYGLGRTGAEAWGLRLPPRLPYLLMAAVLVATQFVGGWGSVLLFVPFGLLAAVADARLAHGVDPAGDLQQNWSLLERSSALGGLAGSLGMGLVAQLIGLGGSLPIQLAAFLGAGVLLPLLQRRRH